MALKTYSAAAICLAAHLCNAGQAPEPPRASHQTHAIAPAASIQITRATAETAAGDTAPCAGVRPLTESDVRRFLAHARPITRQAALHDDFQVGDCYTEARVRFQDGRTASLGIANDAGTALLTPIVEGREQAQGRYFRCTQCAGMLDLPDRLPTH
ncbi:hypothetical protein AVXHC19_43340 [Acidovorax sacchari]